MNLFLSLIIWNVVVFLVYGFDKHQAKVKKRRIRESTLLLISFLMGAVGANVGMYVFRHKTKHTKFRILNPLFLIINGVAIYFYLSYDKI